MDRQARPYALGTSSLLAVSAAGPGALTIGGHQWYSRKVSPACPIANCIPVVHANPLLQRGNGDRWAWNSTPGMPGNGEIEFVDAVTSTDAWAAGRHDAPDGHGLGMPYIARSDQWGWSEVPAPRSLLAVEALDATETGAWVAGAPVSDGGPSVHYWAHGEWRPHSPGGAVVHDLKRRTATDVWVAGHTLAEGTRSERGYVGRFDGSAWHTMTPPQVLGKPGRITAVLPVAADDVWVTGHVWENGARKDASWHWDGSQWREDVLSVSRFGDGLELGGVTSDAYTYSPADIVPDGAGGVWAIASTIPPYNGQPRVLHYTDGAWRLEKARTDMTGAILALASVPGQKGVWAVGQRDGKAPLVLYTE